MGLQSTRKLLTIDLIALIVAITLTEFTTTPFISCNFLASAIRLEMGSIIFFKFVPILPDNGATNVVERLLTIELIAFIVAITLTELTTIPLSS